MQCNRCDGTGFLNIEQIPQDDLKAAQKSRAGFHESIVAWMSKNQSDVMICDCCGDGTQWHCVPGHHFQGEPSSTYDYNGGLPECK